MANNPALNESRPAFQKLLLLIFFLLVSYLFALDFARTGNYFLRIEDYTAGHGELPFQYRILMAPVFKALLQVLSAFDIQSHFLNMPEFVRTPEQVAYLAVNFVGFFFAILFFDQISKTVFASRSAVFWADFIFIVSSYSIFILNPNLNFILPYDLPALAFAQLSTLLILRKKWLYAVLVFAVATINRETSFIVVVFLASRIALGLETGKRAALLSAVALSIIWVAIKIALLFFVVPKVGGGGGVAALKIQYNLITMLKPWQWAALLPLALPLTVCIFGILMRRNPAALSWSSTYLLGFAALFVVAQITECRAFADLIGFSAISTIYVLASRGVIPDELPDATGAPSKSIAAAA